MPEGGAPCVQGLETLVRLNGKAKEDLSKSEQSSLAEYPLSLRILAQTSGIDPPGCSSENNDIYDMKVPFNLSFSEGKDLLFWAEAENASLILAVVVH